MAKKVHLQNARAIQCGEAPVPPDFPTRGERRQDYEFETGITKVRLVYVFLIKVLDIL
jgi:hypothetical protein